jgi:hypothetical protein
MRQASCHHFSSSSWQGNIKAVHHLKSSVVSTVVSSLSESSINQLTLELLKWEKSRNRTRIEAGNIAHMVVGEIFEANASTEFHRSRLDPARKAWIP